MAARQITKHVFRVSLGMVNVFLIVLPEGLTLVDAGTQGSFDRIARAVRGLGRPPEEITDIVVTHCHADHTGGLAKAAEATGARVWMHPADAALVRAGGASRPWKPAPGSLTGLLARPFAGKGTSSVVAVSAEGEVVDGQEIPAAGGLLPLWTPGHTEGHVVYLWPRDGRVLFVGDAATRMLRLRPGPIYEDYERGLESLRTLARLDFEVACFSHGRPLAGGASAAFRMTWPS
jgi:glyoxylase-like metal-dependent hydrolase (beta-lactamase superfamily II)